MRHPKIFRGWSTIFFTGGELGGLGFNTFFLVSLTSAWSYLFHVLDFSSLNYSCGYPITELPVEHRLPP